MMNLLQSFISISLIALSSSAVFLSSSAVFAQSNLVNSEALDAEQMSNELFTSKLKEGCKLESGQELNVHITNPTIGEGGIYLLNTACGTTNRQYLMMVQPHDGNLKEVLYASLGDSKSEGLVYQQEFRRLFALSNGKLREIEWQVAAKKKIKKGEEKSVLNKALFSKTVPKGNIPEIN